MSIYSKINKLVPNETLIQKGQKLYLEGKVLASKEELIPHWHNYGVKDHDKIQEVTLPTIHLINPEFCSMDFYKLAHCNCEYFHIMGYCHHISAVLSLLDDKYKSSDETTKVSDSLWDTLMLGEKSTILNQYKFHLANYFEFSWEERDITKNLGSISKDIIKYPEVKDILSEALQKGSKEFNNEVKIISLFTHPYLSAQNSALWFRIFIPYLKRIHSLNKESMGIKMFVNIYSNIFTIDSHVDMLNFLKSMDDDVKYGITLYLTRFYKKQPKVWMIYALKAEDKKSLIQNLDSFDIPQLLIIANICPHDQDLIENKVYNLVKEWSNFLFSTDYTELLSVIEKWYLTYGKTELFIDAIDYIIINHPKKKNLIKELQNY
jgi:hypothetical protein